MRRIALLLAVPIAADPSGTGRYLTTPDGRVLIDSCFERGTQGVG